MFSLLFHNGPWRGRRVSVRATEAAIGSGPACELRLVYDGLAARHARLRVASGEVWIEALDGAEVRVNGAVRERAPLADRDRIGLGGLELIFRGARRRRVARAARRLGMQRLTAVLIGAAIAGQVGMMIAVRRVTRFPSRLERGHPEPEPARTPEAAPEPEADEPIRPFFEEEPAG